MDIYIRCRFCLLCTDVLKLSTGYFMINLDFSFTLVKELYVSDKCVCVEAILIYLNFLCQLYVASIKY